MRSIESELFHFAGSDVREGEPDPSLERVSGNLRRFAVLPRPHEVLTDESRRVAALQAIAEMSGSEALIIRLRWRGGSESLQASIGLCGAQGRSTGSGPKRRAQASRLDALLAYLWPAATVSSVSERAPLLPRMHVLKPMSASRSPSIGPRLVATNPRAAAEELLHDRLDRRRFDLTAALAILKAHRPSDLVIRLASFRLDARGRCAVQSAITRHHALALAPGAGTTEDEALLAFLQAINRSGAGVRIEVLVRFAGMDEADRISLALLSLALFGSPADSRPPIDEPTDLRGVWPIGWALPQILPTESEARVLANMNLAVQRKRLSRTDGAVVLGRALSGERIGLSARDRTRHLYVIGATGTGKSSLLLNLIRQDIEAGEGVIVIDPHGDLVDAARRLVPERRRSELTWADLSDPSGSVGLNILRGQGGATDVEHNYVCNQLITLFRRVLYRGVPEAFGPMFETYFRNGLMLLLNAGGPKASLMDFERVFHDEAFRTGLVARCRDAKVTEFWREVAHKVSYEEIRLENITPYIVSKLTQLTGNPLVRRFIEAPGDTLDLRRIMDRGEIALIKFAKGLVGDYDAMLIASLIAIRLAQAGMGRATQLSQSRRPVRVYIDEFQICACDALHDMLAETRKYGLSLSLANQSLSQVDGRGGRSDAGHAVLANVANLVALRLGAPDAMTLAPWFAPDVEWPEICRLPDFHAVVRVLDDGRPMRARTLRIDRPW